MKINHTKNTLVVLGNGFDLHSGVPSKFSHYFDKICKAKLKMLYDYFDYGQYEKAKELLNCSDDYSINFWSFAFYIQHYTTLDNYRFNYVTGTNWFNVEYLIKLYLTSSIYNGFKLSNYLDEASKLISRKVVSNLRCAEAAKARTNPYIFFPCLQNNEIENIYDYLIKELNKFESNFKIYLESNLPDDYDESSFNLLNRLINNVYGYVDIINFNYTIINYRDRVDNQTNVHGTLGDNEIIIGIDSNDIVDQNIYRFTKTYRNLHRYKATFKLPDSIENIIFYGHSLSDGDFSYFYSLFDMYNLFGGKLKLLFKYSDYEDDSEKNDRNHAKYVEQIYKLINKYSSKSHNNDNLLHRLLLEGRIIIEKL